LVPSPAAGVAGHGAPSSSSPSRYLSPGDRDAPTIFASERRSRRARVAPRSGREEPW
jgi:hypothetical protein